MSRQIFIGGTGRSGTTILSKILAKHPDAYALPHELRFITDPDGVLSLKNAIVDNWSYYQADIAIGRFRALLVNLSTRFRYKYPNADFKNMVGSEFYFQWVEDFCSAFCDFSFKSAWGARVYTYQKALLKLCGKNSFTNLLLETSYYCPPLDEPVFIEKAQHFLRVFFDKISEKQESDIIIDHTPTNLNHADEVLKICPDAKFIHIFRDPRDVAVSMNSKDWGMGDMRRNLQWYKAKMDRWESIKPKIPKEKYIEIRFEDLINDFSDELERICAFLNISIQDEMLSMDVSKHNIGHWEKNISKVEEKMISTDFHELIKKYGY